MVRRIRGRLRMGFTMVECLAALAVLAATVCLWSPLVQIASHMTTKDEEMVELQAAQRQLERYCTGGSVSGEGNDTLVLVDQDGVRRTIAQYHSQANGNILRVETDNGGYVPILMHARKLLIDTLADNTWVYKVTMDDGLTFRGVLTNGQTTSR